MFCAFDGTDSMISTEGIMTEVLRVSMERLVVWKGILEGNQGGCGGAFGELN